MRTANQVETMPLPPPLRYSARASPTSAATATLFIAIRLGMLRCAQHDIVYRCG